MRTPHDPPRRPSVPPESRLVGATIGEKYRVKRLLGHGGMGSVYKAENTAIGRTVAVKLLHTHLADDGVALARFQREARAAASVGHPHVVEVLDMGVEANGAPYIVMEYVRGKSVAKAIRTEGAFDTPRAAAIAGQILDALQAVHARGIVHRDLKPENVLLTVVHGRSDWVKVFDFGVSTFTEYDPEVATSFARDHGDLTPSGRTMGTPQYASPEQLRGAAGRDPRVDIYAVGILLYEMLTGHRPFEAANLADLCKAILEHEPTPLRAFRRDVPAALEAVVMRALAKDASRRWPDADAMLAALVPFGAEARREDEPEPTDTFTVDLRELRAREDFLRATAVEGDDDPPTQDGRPADVLRGEVVLAMREFLASSVSGPVLGQLIASAPEEVRARALGEVTPTGWYPGGLLDLLEAADARSGQGPGQLLAEAGRFFARRVFGGADMQKAMMKTITPELLFATTPDLWRRYFASGVLEVKKVGRGYGRLEITGQAEPRLSRGIALVGFVGEALRLAGARDVDVRLAKSIALGDSADVIEGTWNS